MTRPLTGFIFSVVIVPAEGGQHHGGNLFRGVIGVKGAPRIRCSDQAVVVLGGQQDEFASAAGRDLDRPSERGLDDLAGSIAPTTARAA
jgi:hypothetical protein